MRILTAAVVLIALLAPLTLLQQPAVAGNRLPVQALFFKGNPATGGRLLAVTAVNNVPTADFRRATHVVLHTSGKDFAFVIARLGSTVESTQVRASGRRMPLADVATAIVQAQAVAQAGSGIPQGVEPNHENHEDEDRDEDRDEHRDEDRDEHRDEDRDEHRNEHDEDHEHHDDGGHGGHH